MLKHAARSRRAMYLLSSYVLFCSAWNLPRIEQIYAVDGHTRDVSWEWRTGNDVSFPFKGAVKPDPPNLRVIPIITRRVDPCRTAAAAFEGLTGQKVLQRKASR